jgi:multiple sugar transport system substrate-binding protein
VGKQKKEAWEFVKFMTTNKEIQTLSFVKMGAYPAIVEAQDKAFLSEPIPYLGGQQARLLWSDAAAKIPSMKPDRFDGVALEITTAALDDVLERGKSIDQALADANAQLKRRTRR